MWVHLDTWDVTKTLFRLGFASYTLAVRSMASRAQAFDVTKDSESRVYHVMKEIIDNYPLARSNTSTNFLMWLNWSNLLQLWELRHFVPRLSTNNFQRLVTFTTDFKENDKLLVRAMSDSAKKQAGYKTLRKRLKARERAIQVNLRF